ncbi:MAG: hypothetical protein U0176_03155 [Bacteroidia bacterium]
MDGRSPDKSAEKTVARNLAAMLLMMIFSKTQCQSSRRMHGFDVFSTISIMYRKWIGWMGAGMRQALRAVSALATLDARQFLCPSRLFSNFGESSRDKMVQTSERTMLDRLKAFEAKRPEIVFEWKDSETEAEGWVVINSLRGAAFGEIPDARGLETSTRCFRLPRPWR